MFFTNAAPSANASKHTSPVTANHVYEDLSGKIPLILDGGKCQGGIESTVLDVTTDTPIILRSGLVTYEMIKKVVGKCGYSESKPTDKVKSPGVKYQHYTPKCKTALFKRNELSRAQELYNECNAVGLRVYFMCDQSVEKNLNGKVLKLGQTATEIASNLYDCLHEAEKIADMLIAIDVETGSGIDDGIMNRLTKACQRY